MKLIPMTISQSVGGDSCIVISILKTKQHKIKNITIRYLDIYLYYPNTTFWTVKNYSLL